MNATRPTQTAAHEDCRNCRRRSWLLGELSPLLDYQRGDPERLLELLQLGDEQLIGALGGRRRTELSRAWSGFSALSAAAPGVGLCRHSERWPARLRDCEAPAMLWLSSPAPRLERLLAEPTVALLGSRHPSPYGRAMAASLARGLAAAGVTVIAPLPGGLAAAAHSAAIEAKGGAVAVAGDGLARIRPASAAHLARELGHRGCVLSELWPQASGRGWGPQAAHRTVVGLADLVVLLEAGSSPGELLGPRIAVSLRRPLAALPGPVTSGLSEGPHSLIRSGASLIRDAEDVLEVLYEQGCHDRRPDKMKAAQPGLRPGLRAILLRVGAGEDTAERLARGAQDPGAVDAALGELEAMGLLERLPSGRYMAREPATRHDRVP